MVGNQKQILRDEETIVAGAPDQIVSQVQTTAPGSAQPLMPPPAGQTTVQTRETTAPVGESVVSRQVAERVVDPAMEKTAYVGWLSRAIWFIVSLMVVLLAIRFVLLGSGANESAGFAQLIYGLTGWMVAPFAGLFGQNVTYPGTAQAGVFEPAALVAILVYALIGWGLARLAVLMLGTNRNDSVVYQDTQRRTRV